MCVCLYMCVWGGTPGYHDNPSGHVGGVRAPAWLLLGGLLEFSSGMPPKTQPPFPSCGLRRRHGERIIGKRKSRCHLTPVTDKDRAAHRLHKYYTKTENPIIPNPSAVVVFVVGSTVTVTFGGAGGKHFVLDC